MNFTDIFIRRPVLASVVSLVILVVGLRSYSSLQVLAYPKTENGIVTITTTFPGADPDAIAGFITTPIEAADAALIVDVFDGFLDAHAGLLDQLESLS